MHTAVMATNQGSIADDDVSVSAVPMLFEEQLTEWQGRLRSQRFTNNHVAMYVRAGSKNTKKNLLRVDLQCERVRWVMKGTHNLMRM